MNGDQTWAWFRGTLFRLVATLRDWRLLVLIGVAALLLTLATWPALQYRVAVGLDDRPGSDVPLISGVWPGEQSARGLFRWSRGDATLTLGGIGVRPAILRWQVLPISGELASGAPNQITVVVNGQEQATVALRHGGGTIQILLPPTASGTAQIELRSTTFTPPGDQRAIGVPLGPALLSAPGGVWFAGWPMLLRWLLAIVPGWLAVRWAGWSPDRSAWILGVAVALLGIAALLDPPRMALGARPVAIVLAVGWLLVAGFAAAAPPLYCRALVPFDNRTLRWLLLLALLVFALRYGGKLYPEAMAGDIGFHSNRLSSLIRGTVLLAADHRGVDNPYPSAAYLLLAPLLLAGLDGRVVLQSATALLDASSPLLMYALAAVMLRARRPTIWGVVAAGVYSLSASGFMAYWWNFSTHVFTQWAHLLLLTLLVVVWRRWRTADVRGRALLPGLLLLGTAQLLVYLGHFGFWINMVLFDGLLLLGALIVVRGPTAEQARARWLAASVIVTQLLAGLLFYSAFAGLFVGQIEATADGGFTELAHRDAVPASVLWATLWDAGLRVHFGLFPVVLGVGGTVLLCWRNRLDGIDLGRWLLLATWAIALLFAALPFLTASSLATRWLMFSAWAVAIGTAAAARELWRTGWAARLMLWAIGGYMIWITAAQWLAALAWRVRPPEPF